MLVLLAQRAADPAWHAGHAPYWSSWPVPGTVFTKETFTAADLAELQDEDLVSQMRGWRRGEEREAGRWGGPFVRRAEREWADERGRMRKRVGMTPFFGTRPAPPSAPFLAPPALSSTQTKLAYPIAHSFRLHAPPPPPSNRLPPPLRSRPGLGGCSEASRAGMVWQAWPTCERSRRAQM